MAATDLEVKLYDEDPFKSDDLISFMKLDVSSLTVGKKETREVIIKPENVLDIKLYDQGFTGETLYEELQFDVPNLPNGMETKELIIQPQTEQKLLIAFELLQSEDPPCEYLTNGVLLAAPLSVLDINIDNLQRDDCLCDKELTLRGAYDETGTLNAKEPQKLRFYVNRDLETELGVAPSSFTPLETYIHLQPQPEKHGGTVSVCIDQDTVDFDLETKEGEGLGIRLGFDIPTQEKEFLKKRSVVVSQALQKLFGASTDPKTVPKIAVVASGGGSRAMTCLLGSLRGLKDIGVLDAVTYITGVSGSTWAMSDLYQEPNWSQQDVDSVISAKKEQMTQHLRNLVSLEKHFSNTKRIAEKEQDGYTTSFIDRLGLVFEQLVFGKKVTSTLSEQRRAVNEGQNPLPIYTAVNMRDIRDSFDHIAEWCEFTPYEVGIQKYGAFVRTEDFGSHFFLGNVVKKLPEVHLPYLIGIWSSAISVNLCEISTQTPWSLPSLSTWFKPEPEITRIEPSNPEEEPFMRNTNLITDVCTTRPLVAEMNNFMRGLSMHRDYIQHNNFVDGDETHPDAFPNKLTPSDSSLRLIDSGHVINIACVPVLRPERDVDLIISLSYSWEPHNILAVLEKTADHCKEHDIPFPNADFASLQKEPQKEFYIFEDKENPRAPIVVHFPLVNVTYKHFKRPGVKRETTEEIRAGEVDVSGFFSPYKTYKLTYSEENYDALVDLTTYNILNNKENILEALRKAMERRASKTKK
ncbi:cytosolic phospholipase A2 zeta-like [Clinocottus analis]|uniref:cytosolic phospholipase A2 zeta-like n=1 Tax=Clinocottus analis TaxID=304258 RepID=UPI0035C0E91F